jgi:hypothetical protein
MRESLAEFDGRNHLLSLRMALVHLICAKGNRTITVWRGLTNNGMMKTMKNPCVGQRVRVDGLTGTFTVVRVNTYQDVADLELTTGTRKIEMHIPFSAINPAGEDYRRKGASTEIAS